MFVSALRLRRLTGVAVGLALAITSGPGYAETGVDLSTRIAVDGFSDDFTPGEAVFGFNAATSRDEESDRDSRWGPFNDVRQVYMTWDAENVYFAVDATIDSNNLILLIDIFNGSEATTEDDGLFRMTELNAWRRNFVFSPDFTPDLFTATWDQNTVPQVWYRTGPDQVTQLNEQNFLGAATFVQSSDGRALEVAIPWSSFYTQTVPPHGPPVFVPEYGVEVYPVPDGMSHVRLAAVITAGADGTGGPDSAPDNLCGHTIESADRVLIDNYAIVPLDLEEPFGIPDFGIAPGERVEFKARPPITGVTCSAAGIELLEPVASPEEGLDMEFELTLPAPTSEADAVRTVSVTARIYDLRGQEVLVLYQDDPRVANDATNPALDRWDGRLENGRPAPGGVYILSVVTEPSVGHTKKAFSVVR